MGRLQCIVVNTYVKKYLISLLCNVIQSEYLPVCIFVELLQILLVLGRVAPPESTIPLLK